MPLDKKQIESLFGKNEYIPLPTYESTTLQIEAPLMRKIHSRSAVAAPTAELTHYKELRHRKNIMDNIDEKELKSAQLEAEFQNKRNLKLIQDAAATERRRNKRRKKTKSNKKAK